MVAFDFGGFDSRRFEKCDEQGAEHVAGTDDPGGDTVDAGVEIIEADMDAIDVTVSNYFAGDGKKVVGEGYDVVAIPMNTAADVEHDLGQELEDAGDFV